MPFTYRDKPRLSERLRGKSGEELLNELKSDLDKDRRMFFDTPNWGTRGNTSGFPKGFPFDDDRSRPHFKSYLDDIAARHPEFAESLKDPHWNDDFNSSFGRKRRVSEEDRGNNPSGSSGESAKHPCEEPTQQEPQQQQQQPNLNQFGLRNTVPLAQNGNPLAEEERKQRSMSAPPENRSAEKPKRFVSKCEIPMRDPTQEQGKPPVAPKSTPEQKPSSPNVRVIPIQVEGRDEPVINANIDTSANFAGETFREPVFEARLPRDFGNYQQQSPRFSKKEWKQQTQRPQQQPQQQKQSQSQPPQPSVDEVDSKPPQPPQPKPEPPKDPLAKVQIVQKEVEELMKQVESFDGKSRKDKQYMILDELLTRNLISLDNIETEGKENVRQARKDCIRSIQRCISILESKVPVVHNNETNESGEVKTEESQQQPMEVEDQTNKESKPMEVVDDQSNKESKQNMDVDQTKENTSEEIKKEEKSDEQKMEVDVKEPAKEPDNNVKEQSSEKV